MRKERKRERKKDREKERKKERKKEREAILAVRIVIGVTPISVKRREGESAPATTKEDNTQIIFSCFLIFSFPPLSFSFFSLFPLSLSLSLLIPPSNFSFSHTYMYVHSMQEEENVSLLRRCFIQTCCTNFLWRIFFSFRL